MRSIQMGDFFFKCLWPSQNIWTWTQLPCTYFSLNSDIWVCMNDSFYSLALHVWMSEWLFLFTYFTGVIYGQSETPLIMDVTEGTDVTLKCRFQPELSQRASQLFWIRTNREGHDNVAIGETPYQTNYM